MKKYSQTVKQLHQMVDQGIVPGMSYLIFDGQQEQQEIYGLAQTRPFPERLRSGMQYDLASLTKVIGTVPVIQLLIQAGQLKLNDPVKKYLPQFTDDRPTIRHLLTHTSGIEGYIPHRNELSASELTNAFLKQMHVSHNFNHQIRYADVNFLYLGWIIERFYKKPVQQVISEQVLRPLKMVDASFHPVVANCVPTEIQSQRGLIRGEVHDPKGYILGQHCGCAGLFATLNDLSIFSHALIETNLNGLLSSTAIDELFCDQTLIPGPHSRSLGWKLLHAASDGHSLISHTGFTGTWLILDRQTDQGMIVLTNRVHPTANNSAFLDMRDHLIATYLQEKEKTL